MALMSISLASRSALDASRRSWPVLLCSLLLSSAIPGSVTSTWNTAFTVTSTSLSSSKLSLLKQSLSLFRLHYHHHHHHHHHHHRLNLSDHIINQHHSHIEEQSTRYLAANTQPLTHKLLLNIYSREPSSSSPHEHRFSGNFV